jgi:sensor histidine kinase regulating citrate/malate metabolism
MDHYLFPLLALIAATMVGFMIMTILWLKRLRDSVAKALQQTVTSEAHALADMQKKLDGLSEKQNEHQLHIEKLAEGYLRQRHDLQTIAERLRGNHDDKSEERPRWVH